MDDDMPSEQTQPASQGRHDSAENQEQYLLQNHQLIIQKLRLLIKNHVFITASFNNGSQSMNTAIVDVIRDMDLVAIDYGPNQSLNEQLLNASRIVFKASFDGINVQFSSNSITTSRNKRRCAGLRPS